MEQLIALSLDVGARLRHRSETVAVAESSSGGLISAALLAQANASTIFLGGSVIYTAQARAALLGIGKEAMLGMRSSTEDYALLLARTIRERLGSTWGLAETGAAGPSGNRYGDPAGHSCIAVAGPVEIACTLATGADDRFSNMLAFASRTLELLREQLVT